MKNTHILTKYGTYIAEIIFVQFNSQTTVIILNHVINEKFKTLMSAYDWLSLIQGVRIYSDGKK